MGSTPAGATIKFDLTEVVNDCVERVYLIGVRRWGVIVKKTPKGGVFLFFLQVSGGEHDYTGTKSVHNGLDKLCW